MIGPVRTAWRAVFRRSPALRRVAAARALRREAALDARRFADAIGRDHERDRRRARLFLEYHKLEKGLALTSPRPGFGAGVVAFLIAEVPAYRRAFGVDEALRGAVRALAEYQRYNHTHGVTNEALDTFLAGPDAADLLNAGAGEDDGPGGTRPLTAAQVRADAGIDFAKFMAARASVRSFAPQPVDRALLAGAVADARRSPSVCNRQSWHVHAYDSPDSVRRVLKHQSGNRGFTDEIPLVVVVTSDLRQFMGVQERNQAYIDGGMFAMSLVLALHARGLGTCCLNLSVDNRTGDALRRAGTIPAHEALIMCIAVGHLPDRLRVACSARKPVDELLSFHD